MNAATAARLLAEKKGQGEAVQDGKPAEGGLMADQRFSRMFEDPAFAIDERSEEFRTLHPNARMILANACDCGPCLSPSCNACAGGQQNPGALAHHCLVEAERRAGHAAWHAEGCSSMHCMSENSSLGSPEAGLSHAGSTAPFDHGDGNC